MDFGLLWNALRSAATNIGNFFGDKLTPTEEQKQKAPQPPPQKAPVSPQTPKPKTRIERAPFVSMEALRLPEVQRFRTFLEQNSTTFKKASPQEKERILVDIITSPQKFFSLASKDKGLRPILNSPPEDIQTLQKTLEDLTQKVRTTTIRTAGGAVQEAYFDPITGLVGAGASAVISKLPFLRTLASWYAGGIAGETAKQTYEASTGKEAPFWVTMPADIIAGTAAWKIGERAAKKAGEKAVKEIGEKESTRIAEEPVKETDIPRQMDLEEAKQWITKYKSDPREGFLSYPHLFPKTRTKIVEELLQPIQLQIDPKEAGRWAARYERDPRLGFLSHPSLFPKTTEKVKEELLQASQLKMGGNEARWWGHLLRIDPEFVPLLFSRTGDLRDEFLQIAERIGRGPSQFALKTKGKYPPTVEEIREFLKSKGEEIKELLQMKMDPGEANAWFTQYKSDPKQGFLSFPRSFPKTVENIKEELVSQLKMDPSEVKSWSVLFRSDPRRAFLLSPSSFPKTLEKMKEELLQASQQMDTKEAKWWGDLLGVNSELVPLLLPKAIGKVKEEFPQFAKHIKKEPFQFTRIPKEEFLLQRERAAKESLRIEGEEIEAYLRSMKEIEDKASQAAGKAKDELLYIKKESPQFTLKATEELSRIMKEVKAEFPRSLERTEVESLQATQKIVQKLLPIMEKTREELLQTMGKTKDEVLQATDGIKEESLQTARGIRDEVARTVIKISEMLSQGGVKTKEEALQATEEIMGKLSRIARKIDEKLSQGKGPKGPKSPKDGPEGPPSPPKGPPRGPEEPPPTKGPKGSEAKEIPSSTAQAARQVEDLFTAKEPETPPKGQTLTEDIKAASATQTAKQLDPPSATKQPESLFTEAAKETKKAQTRGSTGGLKLSSNIKQWEGVKGKLDNILFYTDDDFVKKLSSALRAGQIDTARAIAEDIHRVLLSNLRVLHRSLFGGELSYEPAQLSPNWQKSSEFERLKELGHRIKYIHGRVKSAIDTLDDRIKRIQEGRKARNRTEEGEHFYDMRFEISSAYDAIKSAFKEVDAILKIGGPTTQAKPSSKNVISTILRPTEGLEKWEEIAEIFRTKKAATDLLSASYALKGGEIDEASKYLGEVRTYLFNSLNSLSQTLFNKNADLEKLDHRPIAEEWTKRGLSEKERVEQIWEAARDLRNTLSKVASSLKESIKSIDSAEDYDKVAAAKEHFPLLTKNAEDGYSLLKEGAARLDALLRAHDEFTKPGGGGQTLYSFTDPVSASIHALGQAWRAISNAIKGDRSAEELLKDIDPAAYELVKQQRGGERLRNIFMKLLPRYDQLAKVPYGPQIFRAAETYTKGFERDLQRFFREDWADLFRVLEKLGDSDKKAVRQALEGEIPIESLSPKLQEVVGKSRQWLDSIFEYAKREGLIEAEKYRKDYFPRVFDGNIVVSSEKGYRVAGNWDEALKVASEWANEGAKPKMRIYMSLDTPKAMETFDMTTTRIDLEPQDVQQVLASFKEEGPKVAEKVVGNLLERRYGAEGYIKDPVKALETYGYRVVKKVWQDKLVNEVKPYLDAIKDPVLENGVKSYLRQVLGYPTPTEEALAHTLSNIANSRVGKILTQILFGKQGVKVNPGDVKKGIGFANIWLNHVSMMGWMISTSLMNLVQALHVVPAFVGKETGIALREFARYLKKDQGKLKELYEVGVISKPEVFASVSPEKLAQVFLKPMEKFDEVARVIVYETAKSAASVAAKGGEEAARQFMAKKLKAVGIQQNDPVMGKILEGEMGEAIRNFAVAFTDRAQFRYEVYASPEALSSSVMRLLFPYKSFLINYLTLSTHYLTNGLIKRNDVKGALTFFAVPLLLGGVYVHPFIGMPFAMLDKIAEQAGYDLKEVVNEELGPMGIVLTRGVPVLGDIDIRRSLEVIIPTAPQELFGPIPQAGMKMVGQINQGIDPTSWEDWKAVLGKGAEAFTPRLVKAASEAKDMWGTGLIRDKQGRVVGEATEKDAILRVLGFQPEEKVRYYDARQDIVKLDKMVERRYEPKFDELANAIVEGNLNKAEKLKNEILQDIEKWHEKAKKSEGVERAKAEWVVRKLVAGMRGLERRVQNRMVPYKSDKKSMILYQELMGDDAYKDIPISKKWRQKEVDIEEEEDYY